MTWILVVGGCWFVASFIVGFAVGRMLGALAQ